MARLVTIRPSSHAVVTWGSKADSQSALATVATCSAVTGVRPSVLTSSAIATEEVTSSWRRAAVAASTSTLVVLVLVTASWSSPSPLALQPLVVTIAAAASGTTTNRRSAARRCPSPASPTHNLLPRRTLAGRSRLRCEWRCCADPQAGDAQGSRTRDEPLVVAGHRTAADERCPDTETALTPVTVTGS